MAGSAGAAVNGVWKFVAVSLVAVFVALSVPSIGWFVDSRDQASKSEITFIRERQVQVLIRLGVIEEQVGVNEELIREIQRVLEEHRQREGG